MGKMVTGGAEKVMQRAFHTPTTKEKVNKGKLA